MLRPQAAHTSGAGATTPQAQIMRGPVTSKSVTSPFTVTSTPFVQDMTYYAVGQ